MKDDNECTRCGWQGTDEGKLDILQPDGMGLLTCPICGCGEFYVSPSADPTKDDHYRKARKVMSREDIVFAIKTVGDPSYLDLQSLIVDIATWSDATFGEGQRTTAILHHLKKEVHECIEAVEKFQECNIKSSSYSESERQLMAAFFEFGDCFMLLLDSAHHFGLSANALISITRQKLEINKQRKWGRPDENGVVEHVREGGVDQ